MVRTRIYLTERERVGLESLCKTSGRKQTELIRVAMDRACGPGGTGNKAVRNPVLVDTEIMFRGLQAPCNKR